MRHSASISYDFEYYDEYDQFNIHEERGSVGILYIDLNKMIYNGDILWVWGVFYIQMCGHLAPPYFSDVYKNAPFQFWYNDFPYQMIITSLLPIGYWCDKYGSLFRTCKKNIF